MTGPQSELNRVMPYLQSKFWMKRGPVEMPDGPSGSYLRNEKVRTTDAIETHQNPKLLKKMLKLLGLEKSSGSTIPGKRMKDDGKRLQGGDIFQHRSGVGMFMYTSNEREDIKFSAKELARHIQEPRACDWENLPRLAK